MKHLFPLCLLISLTGVSCTLPQRTRTFLPPTNERDLCQSDRRFHYSQTYGYCFRFGDDTSWQLVQSSGQIDAGIPSVTSENFFISADGQRQMLFTLYVGSASDTTRVAMEREGIILTNAAIRYTIGYVIAPTAEETHPDLTAQVPGMLNNIYYFNTDGSRQVSAP